MNKNRIVLISVGGAIGLIVLALAFLVWTANVDRVHAREGDEEEGTDGLETIQSRIETLSRKPIYPNAASLSALASNTTAVAEWKAEAAKLAARGDRPILPTTPAAFKSFIVADAKRLSALPAAGGAAFVKPDFAFGPFKDYIAEGKMPMEKELPELQRKWDDVALVVETLSAAGIVELTDLAFKGKEVKPDEDAERAKKNNRKAKRPTAKNKQDGNGANGPVAYSYVFTFTTRAPGFVKAINALATCERFVVVDDFTFQHTKDTLAEALGGEEKKKEAARNTGRRRRRGQAAEEPAPETAAAEAALKNGIVTDPLLDAPFTVVLTATVYDFLSLEDGVKNEEEKK